MSRSFHTGKHHVQVLSKWSQPKEQKTGVFRTQLNYKIQGHLFLHHWITKAACYLSRYTKASRPLICMRKPWVAQRICGSNCDWGSNCDSKFALLWVHFFRFWFWHWSKITWITVHQRNRWIHSGKGFFYSFDALYLQVILDQWSIVGFYPKNEPLECSLVNSAQKLNHLF